MSNLITGLTSLIGGGANSLDSLDGNALVDGDKAEVRTSSDIYHYHLNATSGASENSPLRIVPDSNPGTKAWCLIYTSARIGALVKLTSDDSTTSGVGYDVSWDAAEYDDVSFWAGGSPTRLTIPTGVTKVKLTLNGHIQGNANGRRVLQALKDGASFLGRPITSITPSTANPMYLNAASCSLEVTSGNYFETRIFQDSGSSLSLYSGDNTWFSIEAIGFA